MKYQANPVTVDAFKIISIGNDGAQLLLELEDAEDLYEPTPAMLSRITPKVGDYLVIQEDGYHYLNPKDVFERKYSRIEAF